MSKKKFFSSSVGSLSNSLEYYHQEKPESFLVNISVLEGRHYIWPFMDSVVIVQVDKKRKITSLKKSSDSPFYNEYFVFEFRDTLSNFLDKIVQFTVLQPYGFMRIRKVLGSFSLDLATVWNEPDKIFYHKWGILSSTRDVAKGFNGYLKVDIAITGKTEIPKIPIAVQNDEIEGNLLLPESNLTTRQPAAFIFKIYNLEHLVLKTTNIVKDDDLGIKEEPNCNVFIKIKFAGKTARTTSKKGSSYVEFFETLVIVDLFPPLSQKIKIEVYFEYFYKKTIQYSHFIDLKKISDDSEDGFLPTFGPCYIYLYTDNNMEGFGGSLLLSVNTKILNDPNEKKITDDNYTNDCVSGNIDMNLFCTIFNINLINKKHSKNNISVRITFGPYLVQNEIVDDYMIVTNSTVPKKAQKLNKRYSYIDSTEEKPFLSLKMNWCNFTRRMFNFNMLDKIVKNYKEKLKYVETLITNNEDHQQIQDNLEIALEYLNVSCLNYVESLQLTEFKDWTDLDKLRISAHVKILSDIADKASILKLNLAKKKTFKKAIVILKQIELLLYDEQSSFPDIFLWLVQGNKKVAYKRIPAKYLFYSSNVEETGKYCGIKRPYYIYRKAKCSKQVACRVEAIFWLSETKYQQLFCKTFPKGFICSYEGSIPRSIKTDQYTKFQCLAYIMQGHVNPGFDSSGLCDPYVEVIINEYCKSTEILKKKTIPTWNQTLHFTNIYVYGDREYVKNNPPTIVIEVFDHEKFGPNEFVGRAEVLPIVTMHEDEFQSPQLKWIKTYCEDECSAEILSAFQLMEEKPEDIFEETLIVQENLIQIPESIKPSLVNFRMEVLFWGVRNLQEINLITINKPKIIVSLGEASLFSDTISSAKYHSNFAVQSKVIDLLLPDDLDISPPVIVKMMDSRNFGIYIFAGIFNSKLGEFIFNPLTCTERHNFLKIEDHEELYTDESYSFTSESIEETLSEELGQINKIFANVKNILNRSDGKGSYISLSAYEDDDNNDDFDWWTKFFASVENTQDSESSEIVKLEVYDKELELQPQFLGFKDMLKSFELYKGKRTGDDLIDEANITGVFKGNIKVYRWPYPEGTYCTYTGNDLKKGFFKDYPSNDPLKFILRVYCIRGINLRPSDIKGKSDPYLYIKLDNQIRNDKENYVSNQLNPTFGRFFEFNGVFPKHHTLAIQIWDFDRTTQDDLIGETKIDIENRFYTRFRAKCGIPSVYKESGYCKWREYEKPVEILASLCKRYGLPSPIYQESSVTVGPKEFFDSDFRSSGNSNHDHQVLALSALRRWKEFPLLGFELVPEHVETRSLFNPSKPGIEQGKLQLWIDILPRTDLQVPPPIDITPRRAIEYEIRIIIWNVEDVILTEDDFFLGEKKNDLYIKGWLSNPDEFQTTDIHYKSLTGEGQFNWRFIFRFHYLAAENKLVTIRKESFFTLDETESKIPCKLILQIWDNDTFTKDDYLGAVAFELAKIPRGAKMAKKCGMDVLEAPTINIFKIKRTKGWWPFKNIDPETNKDILTGKVELEFEVLTVDEANRNPVGFGRNDPQGLPVPKRPDVSFNWFMNPFRALKFIARAHKWKAICTLVTMILIIMVLVGISAVPQYSVKKILGVK